MICVACGIGVWRKFGTARQSWASCFLTDANHQPDRLRNRSQLLPRWRVTSSSIRSSKNSRPASPGQYLSFGSGICCRANPAPQRQGNSPPRSGPNLPCIGWPMKNRPCFVGFLLRRSIVRTGQLSVQQRTLVHRAICRRQRRRHMPHMRATLASGLVTTVKMVSMLALTAAFSYSVALIAVRVPWVSGRVTLIMRVPSGPVCAPILVVVRPAIRRRSPRASRCLADRRLPERYTFRPGDRNRRRG